MEETESNLQKKYLLFLKTRVTGVRLTAYFPQTSLLPIPPANSLFLCWPHLCGVFFCEWQNCCLFPPRLVPHYLTALCETNDFFFKRFVTLKFFKILCLKITQVRFVCVWGMNFVLRNSDSSMQVFSLCWEVERSTLWRTHIAQTISRSFNEEYFSIFTLCLVCPDFASFRLIHKKWRIQKIERSHQWQNIVFGPRSCHGTQIRKFAGWKVGDGLSSLDWWTKDFRMIFALPSWKVKKPLVCNI